MSEVKKGGITQSIRERLGFDDGRLWKRFSARRLELIDSLDLSSRKASEQEEEIKRVAEILRLEFHYGQHFFSDFDKLVRAAVQSVRRNRKRSTKTGRVNVKRQALSHDQSLSPNPQLERTESHNASDGGKPSFLSEIANLKFDGSDSVYDMSYSVSRVIRDEDQSRVAIDSIIRPAKLGNTSLSSDVQLPPLPGLGANLNLFELERSLQTIRYSLLWLMKRSKSCSSSATSHNNSSYKLIGESCISAITALMLESSFSGLSQTSFDYLKDRINSLEFQAKFYRSLEAGNAIAESLDEKTAVTTLRILIGCCVKDFGFDTVVYQLGEAFYLSIIKDFPFVSRSSVPFKHSIRAASSDLKIRDDSNSEASPLTNLATVASGFFTESNAQPILRESSTNGLARKTSDVQIVHMTERGKSDFNQEKKSVKLRFLTSSLDFVFPTSTSAPPRLIEILDNAREAFKLNKNQIYGLRNSNTGSVIHSDTDLENIFAHDPSIELEIFSEKFSPIPIHELTSTVTKSSFAEDQKKIVLPPPIYPKLAAPLGGSLKRESQPRPALAPLLPNFQPLL